MSGVLLMVKCEQVQLIQYVKVRKHQADLKLLQSLLRDSKCLSNKEISKQLNVPLTKVEH